MVWSSMEFNSGMEFDGIQVVWSAAMILLLVKIVSQMQNSHQSMNQ